MKFIAALLFFIIYSCSSTPENKAETNTANAEKQDTSKESIPQPIPGQEISFDAYILYITKTNDTLYLGADKFDFLMGDEAFEAAKKNGDLDTGYNQDGTIAHVGVPNDYYILNESNAIWRFKLSKNALIELIAFNEASFYHKRVSVSSFYDQYNAEVVSSYISTPFDLTFKNGEIISIKEIYVP